MTHGRIALTLSLVVAAGLALAPAVAIAGRSQGRPGGSAVVHGRPPGFHHGGGVRPGGGFHHGGAIHHVAPRPFHGGPRHFGPRPFVRRVVTTGVIAAPLVYYAPPFAYGSPYSYDAAGYDSPLAYAPPPVSYGPNTGGALSLAPAPPADVVEFPTGRYELRGDGATAPYTWVWIPNAPTAPPDASPSPGPSSGVPPLSSQRQVYRWTDETGVAHWTDRLDAVPQQYRAEAQQPRVR